MKIRAKPANSTEKEKIEKGEYRNKVIIKNIIRRKE